MRNIINIFVVLCIVYTAHAQKDKAKYASFNSNNDVVVVFKSGTVALYSNPNLELLKEVSPKDKKNNAAGASISNTGKYVIVSDSKIKARIIYDASDLTEIKRIEYKEYGSPRFVGPEQVFMNKKILSFPDLSLITDISGHSAKHERFAFSPSQSYYVNYEVDDTGGDGEFEVFETASGKSLGNSKLGESATQSPYVISSSTSFIDEEQIKIVYRKFTEPIEYEWIVPTQLGVDNFNLERSETEYDDENPIFFDYQNLKVVAGEYAVDPEGDYSLYQMNSSQNMSNDGQFVVISTAKNKINLYENKEDETEMLGEHKKSTLVKSIEIPAEK